MRRILAIILHNWPLKLAAVGLATVLYGGLVLSQGARTFDGQVPIRPPVIPPGMWLLEPPPPVTSIRYFAPEGTDEPTTDTFRATIDLSGITQGGTYEVPVDVTSVNPDIQILEVTPDIVTVQLDPLITKIVPVEIERGEVPDGLEVGTETATPSTVTVSGPKTIVDQVVAARADVVIQPSGIDVDEDVALIPVDAVGNARSPADVAPTTARISIRVFSEPETRTLPVSPVVTGRRRPDMRSTRSRSTLRRSSSRAMPTRSRRWPASIPRRSRSRASRRHRRSTRSWRCPKGSKRSTRCRFVSRCRSVRSPRAARTRSACRSSARRRA